MAMQNFIAQRRKIAGLSQSELASKIKATLSMVGKLERGERELTTSWLLKISEALACKPADLIHDENDEAIDEFGLVNSVGIIVDASTKEKKDMTLLPSFDGLRVLKQRAYRKIMVEGEAISVDRYNSVTCVASLNLSIPPGSQFLFSWKDMTDHPAVGVLSVIGVFVPDGYIIAIGTALPGTQPDRYHVLPLNGTPMSDVTIDMTTPIKTVLL
ncbi:helix-turn-helix domain-containing protein [Sphingomonas sp. VDB2]|uniref:helix-turn-helix domain-containing protein n=1 Tax=Sphingomonas sp. VDB2 TaxID=3228751 RepID=UPI003A809C2F